MRILSFLLVFANLLFFAYAQGYFGGKTSPDANRLEKQVNPERLRLLGLPDNAPENDVLPPQSQEEASGTSAPPPVAAAEVCLRVDGLAPDLAVQLAGQATILRLAATQHDVGGWWVFIPPQADRAAAEKKAGELTQLGIQDFFIVNNGAQKFAISLGIFSSEEGAYRHLARLREKGVKSARVDQRHRESAPQSLEVRGDPLVVTAFRGLLPAGANTRDCP
jgi:hypothetical protein